MSEITIKIQNPDPSETPMFLNRGFMSVRFSLIQEESEIGFLKMALLTPDQFKAHNPTVWHYAQEWEGLNVNLNAVVDERWEEVFDSLCGSYKLRLSYEDRNLPLSEKMSSLKSIETQLEQSLEENIAGPLFNRPYVDWITVREDLRGKGLAKRLYHAANEYFNEMGYQMTSSSVQSDLAKAVWESMEKSGIVEKRGTFYVFKKNE